LEGLLEILSHVAHIIVSQDMPPPMATLKACTREALYQMNMSIVAVLEVWVILHVLATPCQRGTVDRTDEFRLLCHVLSIGIWLFERNQLSYSKCGPILSAGVEGLRKT
jgi:hypothetical protein